MKMRRWRWRGEGRLSRLEANIYRYTCTLVRVGDEVVVWFIRHRGDIATGVTVEKKVK